MGKGGLVVLPDWLIYKACIVGYQLKPSLWQASMRESINASIIAVHHLLYSLSSELTCYTDYLAGPHAAMSTNMLENLRYKYKERLRYLS